MDGRGAAGYRLARKRDRRRFRGSRCNRAKARGQRMGRPSKLTDTQKMEARRRRAEGATLKELAESYHVGLATISRLTVQRPTITAYNHSLVIDFRPLPAKAR